MRQTRIVIPMLALGAIAALLLVLKPQSKQPQEPSPVPVRTIALSAEPPIETVLISGTTKSAETALLRLQVSGRVLEKKVSLGDKIKAGDVLVTVYNPELEPIAQRAEDNVARAEAEANQARRDFVRLEELFKQQAITRQEWEQGDTRLTSAKTALAAAKSERARAQQVSAELSLKAPFAGSVTEILVDKGEVISAGAPLVRVSNPAAVELALSVSDKIIKQLAIGHTVQVRQALYPDNPAVVGYISEISPFREQGSLPEVTVALDATQIGPGTAVTAALNLQAESGVSLPLRSVIMTGENTVAAYRIENNKAVLIPIRPLNISANSVIIEQGLAPGDAVVIEGIGQLYNGAAVEVQP